MASTIQRGVNNNIRRRMAPENNATASAPAVHNDLARYVAPPSQAEPTDTGNGLPSRGPFVNNTVLDSDVQNASGADKHQLMRSRSFSLGVPAFLVKAKVSPASAVATRKLK